ncbi:uncharacterized protein LOC115628828 [Scaptodrosophila lebanonensis]|uniref:RNA (guanine-9-)-methyltransferase domain-containing protein 1 n=1 Tax=Drosophila lebanonensis TaxID=7225 RepID=A0A6J2U0G4_DROLE|nr:uncharacterized protein LOC115628828 [Scaptodrosophila lebanonensis]
MKKFKMKIFRKYEDFLKPEDFSDSDGAELLNLSITDFNARGEVANPRAPCVVTTIDPDYIKDASRQRLSKKFRMKTDILRLREITRNKFMYYSTQEMFLDKKREIEQQNQIYVDAQVFHKFAEESLKKMEAREFKKMLEAQEKLKKLKENKVAEELNQVKLEHQRVLMEVQEVYGRFQYMLKLISYFDDTIEQQQEDAEESSNGLVMPKEIVSMEINERHPAGMAQVQQVQEYMDKVVRPYLAKRNHLNAEIWIKGYEKNRMKVSNYNRRFTQLALLNHLVGIIHHKAQKTYQRQVVAKAFLKDPDFLQRRVAALEKRAHDLLNGYEQKYCKDKLNMKLNSVVPVILKILQNKVHAEEQKDAGPTKSLEKSSKQWRTVEDMQATAPASKTATYEDEQDTTLAKVEKIQSYALELMGKLDKIPPVELRSIEQRVRRRMEKEKETSRRALVKQNRLHNWMEHFKKHHPPISIGFRLNINKNMLKTIARFRVCNVLLKGSPLTRNDVYRNLTVSLKSFAQSPGDDTAAGGGQLETSSKGNPFAQTTLVQENATSVPEADRGQLETPRKSNPFAQTTLVQENATPVPEADREKRLKVLQLEADIAHQEGRRVPQLGFFQDHHWEHVLTLPTKSARIKYYGYLWQIEMKKESEKRKKELRAEETERRLEEMRKEREENTHIIYGLGHTSLFLRIYDSTINHWMNNRLTRAMQFAPKLVLDCSYDAHMNNREASYAAKQLMLSFAENRANDEPFDLHYCNFNNDSVCMQALKRYIPPMFNPEFPMNIHKKCFTELFPKENLVYLTPHCREELNTYNPDDVYIVGAMVDTMNNEPLSLAKAKRLGLRMARLPLDRYLQWGACSGKSLTLNQMINIMLDLKNTGDWDVALKHVPRRKVVDMSREQERGRKALFNRADKLNVRIDSIMKPERDGRRATVFNTPQQVRSHKEGMEFDLNSWATGKKKRSQSS